MPEDTHKTHVQMDQNDDGTLRLRVNGVDFTHHVLSEGFSMTLDDSLDHSRPVFTMRIPADELDIDFGDARVVINPAPTHREVAEALRAEGGESK